jgi:hypothetical protein
LGPDPDFDPDFIARNPDAVQKVDRTDECVAFDDFIGIRRSPKH